MERELILCIPGSWSDRTDFIRKIVTTEPRGMFAFAGTILVDLAAKDHVTAELCPLDPRMVESFKIAGQGKLSDTCLEQIAQHRSVLYVHFPLALIPQRERILKYTRFLRRAGGIAVKLESAGIAHSWETWEDRLIGSLFDVYAASVVLVGDEVVYYSCGMHHFELPECAIPREIEIGEAAQIMNRFNSWQINDRPTLQDGEVFSLPEKPSFRLRLGSDTRHSPDDLFHNPHGVWHLEPTPDASPIANKWKKPKDEPLFVSISRDDPKMAAAYAKAKSSFADFLAATKTPRFAKATKSVKIKIRDNALSADRGEDAFAYLWLNDDVREVDGAFTARVFELPKSGFNDLVVGRAVRFTLPDVHDWMLREGSATWGGFTLRVCREAMDPKQRLNFDDYTGILSYRDTLPGI